VRIFAAYAAARLGEPSRLTELGIALVSGAEPARHTAARLLSRLPGARAQELLIPGLEAPYAGVRARAARGLGREGFDGEAVLEALEGAARDPDPGARAAAALALGEIATARSVRRLAAFTRDPEREVRLAAARALIEAGRREGVGALARGLNDPALEMRAAAVAGLSRLTDEDFGLAPDEVPTPKELDAAVLRAQLWWNEHAGEYKSP
jgi:HEAT repeat protein